MPSSRRTRRKAQRSAARRQLRGDRPIAGAGISIGLLIVFLLIALAVGLGRALPNP